MLCRGIVQTFARTVLLCAKPCRAKLSTISQRMLISVKIKFFQKKIEL